MANHLLSARQGDVAVAEAAGESCSYRTPHHRVLVMSPTTKGGAAACNLTGFAGRVIGRAIA